MNNDCDRNLLLVAIRQKERIGRANSPVLSLSCYSRDSEIAPTGSFLLTCRSAGAGNRDQEKISIALAIHSLDLLQEDEYPKNWCAGNLLSHSLSTRLIAPYGTSCVGCKNTDFC